MIASRWSRAVAAVLATAALTSRAAAAGQLSELADPCAGSSGNVAMFAAAPLAAGVGVWASGRSSDPLGRGLRAFTTIGATTALAAAGSLRFMRCDAERSPRVWLWAAGFAPLAASLVVQHAHAFDSAYERHPWNALGPGLAASVAWFGLVAFTPLGYSDRPRASPDEGPRVMPQLLTLHAGRQSAHGAGLRIRF